ncbi:MAG TPA: Hpt domain-containing protein, partial [Hyphomonadaceae bacterium]|nr:Hpt domain-containing protein [Hyphomonadaceae bacterium]
MTDFTEQFLVEARELAEQASADLLKLEEQPHDKDMLERAFRAFHTLKGAAGIMEYAAMEQLLHRAEDVLQDVRAGGRTITPVLVDALLACVGQLVRWFDVIERTGEMPAGAAADAERLGAGFGSSSMPSVAAPAWQEDLLAWARAEKGGAVANARSAINYRPAADCFFRNIDPLAQIAALPGIIALRLSPATPWPALADLQPFDCNLIIEALSTAPKADIEAALRPDGELSIIQLAGEASASLSTAARAILEEQVRYLLLETSSEMEAGRTGAAARAAANVLLALGRSTAAVEAASADSKALAAAMEAELSGAAPEAVVAGPRETATTIRVEIEKVDRIVNLTGELMVAKNALGHLARLAAEGGDAPALAAGLKTQHELLDRHIADLQRSVFDLRVLPLERVFGRFPRLVRETAGALGKQVSFSTEGEDTKADKAVVEALFEPLLHIIRNAIDHGIEPPSQRTAAGKPAAASI